MSDPRSDAPIGARFRLGRLGRLIAFRSLPGLAAVALAARGRQEAATAGLLLAVAADVAVSSLAARRGWIATASDVEVEGFVDFVCFVWAPVALGVSIAGDWLVLSAAGLFVAAGAYRLARYNVEGLTAGGYLGLPVTYAGVVVPAITALNPVIPPAARAPALAMMFGILAGLMVTRSFVTPRVRL